MKVKTEIEYSELLNQVARLRLFRNTNKELGSYIGYKLDTNNSIKDIHPFTARCIFRELSKEIQEQMDEGLDLETILDNYKRTSEFFDKHIKGKKISFQEDYIQLLLKYNYIDDFLFPPDKRSLETLWKKILRANIDMPILFLLMIGVLPLYTSKKGDIANIQDDFKKMRQFLKEFVKDNKIFLDLPIMERLEKNMQKQYLNRIGLIYFTLITLETFRCHVNPKDYYEMNNEVSLEKVEFKLGDIIWIEPNHSKTPSTFWKFEPLVAKDYFLYQYKINTLTKEIRYTRYEIMFTKDRVHQLLMRAISPIGIANIVTKQKMAEGEFFLFICEIDKSDSLHKIKTQPLVIGSANFLPKELIRLEQEKADEINSCLQDGSYKVLNNFSEIDMTMMVQPTAITAEHIYLQTDDEQSEDISYYRIPKTLCDGLENIKISDVVGTFTLKNRKYIAIVPFSLFLDVTDEEACEVSGVEVVKIIEINRVSYGG